MGAHQSSSKPKLTLAEKRYRVGSPERLKTKRRPKQNQVNGTATGTSNDVNSANQKLSASSSSALALVAQTPNFKDKNGVKQQKNGEKQQKQGKRRSSTSSPTPSSSEALSPLTAYPLSITQGELLSKTQHILIRNSWKRSRKTGTDNVGTKIFLLVLTAQPDIKAIFGLEKIPQGRLKYDPRFRKHALVFNRTFDYIVKNLTFTEKLVQHFQALGKKHVLMQGRGFLPQYWLTFAECMTQTAIEWEGGRRCRDTMIAWRLLVAFIIHQMRVGFDDENNNRRKFTMLAMPQPVGGCPIKPSPSHLRAPHQRARSTSQQYLTVQGHPGLASKLSCQSTNEFDIAAEFGIKCQMSRSYEDDQSDKSLFFTPPSTRNNPILNPSNSFSGFSNVGGAVETDSDSDDDVWLSPRKYPMAPRSSVVFD